MARGRYYNRRRRKPLVLGMLVMAGGTALWFQSGRTWSPAASANADGAIPLAGVRSTPISEPALRPVELKVSTSQPEIELPETPDATPAAPPAAADPSADVVKPVLPTTQPTTLPADGSSADAQDEAQAGLEALARKDLLTARSLLNRAFVGGVPAEQSKVIREKLVMIAAETIFTYRTVKNDPLCEYYTVRSGDTLRRIADRHHVSEDLLAQVNNIRNKNYVREGQRLKVIKGPFHATVSKPEHVLHVYLQDVYVGTFPVALGVGGSTPAGRWQVVNHQENPGWNDPRTGKRWHPDDPENPIGEFWIGLEGIEGDAVGQMGYGIHGTIEPETIGQDVSLGCVRLAAEDIAFIYKLLLPGESLVTITE